MKNTIIALIVGLFSVGTIAMANDTAAVDSAAAPATKVEKHSKKHHKKEMKTNEGSQKSEQKVEKTEKVEAPAAETK